MCIYRGLESRVNERSTPYICLAIMIVFNCLLNVSLSFLYLAACWVFNIGLDLLMWSISLSMSLVFVSALSITSEVKCVDLVFKEFLLVHLYRRFFLSCFFAVMFFHTMKYYTFCDSDVLGSTCFASNFVDHM
jgi:hypothetical protein